MSSRSHQSKSPTKSPSTPKAGPVAYETGPPRIIIDPPEGSRSSTASNSSGSETEMSDRKQEKHRESSKGSSSKSSSKSGSKSSSKSKSSKDQKDDWSEVVEPDERRRIQNRIAQRKFREKARDQKETQERDTMNQQRAAYAYSTPEPGEMSSDYDLSGLPWGGISMKHVVERGRERESQQASQEHSYYDYGTGSNSGKGSESR